MKGVSPGVRIIAGRFRGRRIEVPAGVRPTSARVREALFSIWGGVLAGKRFADLFAGSGAVGLEAASRGASEVLLVDSMSEAVAMQRRAIEALGLTGRVDACRLHLPATRERRGTTRFEEGAVYDYVFADPPYDFEPWTELLATIAARLSNSGELVLEHAARAEPATEAGGLVQVDRRDYGDSALSFYRSRKASSSR